MPEGIMPYPRWQGALAPGAKTWIVAEEEVRAAWRGTWSRLAVLLGLVWGLSSVIELYLLRQDGHDVHQLQWYLDMLDQLRWFSLAVAAAVGGPSLLEDHRRGAMDLYLSRGITYTQYLMGKAGALLFLTGIIFILPAVLYYLATFVFFDGRPPGWHADALAGVGYGLQWSIMVSGVALGISCVARSSRAAAIILIGAFAGLEIVVSSLLSSLTAAPEFEILSPFNAVSAQQVWWFGVENPYAFPVWWGFVIWAVLTIGGWALVALKHPRLRGEE